MPFVLRGFRHVSRCRADMWAVGCIIFQMLEGRPPFRAASEYLCFQKVIAGDVVMPDDLDEHARDLIHKLLVRRGEEIRLYYDIIIL